MKSKILILTTYPAPYRAELYVYFSKYYLVDVFFESNYGDNRDENWFTRGDYKFLETEEGRLDYKNAIQNLSQYSSVILYEYSTKEGRKLIAKCQRKKIPYIVNCDGVILPYKKNLIKDFVKTRLLSKAAAYLASGEHAKEYFLRYGAKEENIYLHHFSALHTDEVLKTAITFEEK